MNKFEAKYLKQSRYWVDSIAIDALNLTLEIMLVANPETQNIDAKLRFGEILKYEGIYHEFNDFSEFDRDYLPALLGIFSIDTNEGIKYTITTDTVEITFITEKEPEIFWLDRPSL